jgi:hypothetical protein
MPDNVGYTPGSGATVAADEIGGVLHQRVKIGVGADGTAVDVSDANPLPVTASNITAKFREAFESYSPSGGKWTEVKGTGDLIFVDGNAVASSYLVVSKSPLSDSTESSLSTVATFGMPVEQSVGLSMSQRTLGQEFSVETVDTGDLIPDTADITINTIQQATTTLTVTTAAPHGLSVGRAIGIRGVVDSRVNYPALVVATVPSPTQFTATAGPGGTIPSLSAYTTTVLAATTAALPANTYSNGASGVGATLTATANGAFPAQDGITLVQGNRLLVKNEATGANNGVYTLTTVGTAGTPWVLTRATDLDTTAELTVVAGVLFAVSVFVANGSTQAQKEYYLSATVTTVGTTAVTWVDTTAPAAPLGSVFARQRLGRARNGVSQIFENATVTNASFHFRSESGDALPSGTVAGNHSVTVATTASVQLAGNAAYTYSWGPTSEYRLYLQADRTQFADSAVDATAQTASRALRTQVCPSPSETYRLRLKAVNAKSLTVPNAQIVSAVKTGTTTATITTDVSHGLLPGDLVTVYGIRAQGATEFPNLTTATAVATVPSATSFTIVIGTAGTVTSYGGFVARVNGGNLPSALGVAAQVAQNATLTTLADNITRQLTITGSASWAAPIASVGDMVELVGCRDNTTGATLSVDGPWKIASISTTTLVLVLPFTDQRTLPANFATTNCGGAVIRRTCLRVSFVRVFDYERQRVETLPRPSGDVAAAAPVVVQSGTIAVSSAAAAGTVAVDAAIGNPVTAGLRATNVNISAMSAAGDSVAWMGTMIGAGIVKPYSLPETDWQTPANIGGLVNTATPLQIKEAAGTGIRNYVTGIDIYAEALTNATDFRIREPDLTCSSQTISSSNLVVSAAHNLAVGDAIVFTATTVTGISTGVTYYVNAIPTTTNITISATRGGSLLAISGTGVTATFHKVLWNQRIPTAGVAPRSINFFVPLRGTVNTAVQIQTATASGAGAVYANLQGYFAP